MNAKAQEARIDQEALNRTFCVVDPGKVVILETTQPLHAQVVEAVRGALKITSEATGVKFVLLPYGLKVASVEQVNSDGEAG